MTAKDAWGLVRATGEAWIDDRAQTMGAALAYYALFSIAPLALIAISIAGFFFGDAEARGEILAQLEHVLGRTGTGAVEFLLTSVSRPGENIAGMIFGVALLIVGSTSVLAELQSDLDVIWHVPDPSRSTGVLDWLRRRLLSLLMVVVLGALLTVSVLASTVLSAIQQWWSPLLDQWARGAGLVEFGASLVLTTVAFALLFKVLPSARIAWKDVWIGAAVTSLLFTLGKVAIAVYIGRTGVASSYGAAGSLVVLLVWIYYSAQIFLVGAEFTWVYAHQFGTYRDRQP